MTAQQSGQGGIEVRKSLVLSLSCALLLAAVAASHAAAGANKPRIAVLEFKNKADNQWWYHGGAQACQDVFVTELVKSGRFRVVEREQLEALMTEKNLALSGDIDPKTAVRAGKLLGVDYLLTGAVTEYGNTRSSVDTPGVAGHGHWLPGVSVGKNAFTAAVNARLIDTETGEIVWADEGKGEESNARVHVGGFGGGVDNDERMFDKVMKPVLQQLVASLKGADL
jgi:curli biogenesis system outer membrane secretion channel CsgG